VDHVGRQNRNRRNSTAIGTKTATASVRLALDALEVLGQGRLTWPRPFIHLRATTRATLQLANTTQLDIDEARVRQHWSIRHNGRWKKSPCHFCWSRDRGAPLVVEKYFGQGRILVQIIPAGTRMEQLAAVESVCRHDPRLASVMSTPRRRRPATTSIRARRSSLRPRRDAPKATAEVMTPRGRRDSTHGH